ncbi:MAG: hypothetical protein K2Q18_13735 [Bdellovibrionales bacterium]|nr:hypothetical protein [Bdellovibrionales bacterium]
MLFLISLNLYAGYSDEKSQILSYCSALNNDKSKMELKAGTNFFGPTEKFKEILKKDKNESNRYLICTIQKMFDDSFDQYAKADFEASLNLKIDADKKVKIKEMLSVLIFNDSAVSKADLNLGPFDQVLKYYISNMEIVKKRLQNKRSPKLKSESVK